MRAREVRPKAFHLALLPNNNMFFLIPISVCIAQPSFLFTSTVERRRIVWAGTLQCTNMPILLMWYAVIYKELDESIPKANVQNNEKADPCDTGGKTRIFYSHIAHTILHLRLLCMSKMAPEREKKREGGELRQKRVLGFLTINLFYALSHLNEPHKEKTDRKKIGGKKKRKNGHWIQSRTLEELHLSVKLGTCFKCISYCMIACKQTRLRGTSALYSQPITVR